MMQGHSRCSICEEILPEGASLFATSGVWLTNSHPLFRYCDSVMHWNCYATWEGRKEFARSYAEFCAENERSNPYWGMAYLDRRVLVTVSPSRKEIKVMPFSTGLEYSVGFDGWQAWLKDPRQVYQRHPLESETLAEVLPLLRRHLPHPDVVVAAVDWEAKQRLLDEEERRNEAQQKAHERSLEEHNERCSLFWNLFQDKSWACPKCENLEFRLSERAGKKSFVICRRCGAMFSGTESEKRQFSDPN